MVIFKDKFWGTETLTLFRITVNTINLQDE